MNMDVMDLARWEVADDTWPEMVAYSVKASKPTQSGIELSIEWIEYKRSKETWNDVRRRLALRLEEKDPSYVRNMGITPNSFEVFQVLSNDGYVDVKVCYLTQDEIDRGYPVWDITSTPNLRVNQDLGE